MSGPAGPAPQLAAEISAVLRREPLRSCFVGELTQALAATGIDAGLVEPALERMRQDGELLVELNYCADPHLDGADLRVVALASAQARANAARVWQRWLASYLSGHRCT